MSTSTKPLVLVVGATGHTGRVLTKVLLADGGFRVAILVRAKSVDKPLVEECKTLGAEVRVGEIGEAPEKIEAYLQGVDILLSLVLPLIDQKLLLRAAKNVGVGRVVPSDFGPTAPRGIMAMHDIKLDAREYIKELGIPYTFIEVGWWLQQMFPYPHAQPNSLLTPKNYIGDRQKKLVYTSVRSICIFVARTIVDPRTLNQTIITSDGEASLSETWAIGEKVSGEDFSDYPRVPDEAILEGTKSTNTGVKVFSQYLNSIYLRGDNTLEAALARGALDARKLYPDIPVVTIEEAAKEFYANPPVPEYDIEEMATMKLE